MQLSVPPWIRARAVATYILIFQGALAFGSVVWGFVAVHIGVADALCLSAAAMGCGLLYTRQHKLRFVDQADVTASPALNAPDVVLEPGPNDGPVAVQIQYCIRPDDRIDFVRAFRKVGIARRRDGGTRWCLYRDLADQNRYIESFVVESWSAYLRHRGRATVADRRAAVQLEKFQVLYLPIVVTRYIAEVNATSED